MPQVFGSDKISLMEQPILWVVGASGSEVEKATHPAVAAEARARGLVPLRIGTDPIWVHPDTGRQVTMTPAHNGDQGNRGVANAIAFLKRTFPTEDELAKANRTPEEIEEAQQAAAKATKTKKQLEVERTRRRREQERAAQFKKVYGPFKDRSEIQEAFDRRSQDAKMVRPRDTVDDFADTLRDMIPSDRLRVHKALFPEKYGK